MAENIQDDLVSVLGVPSVNLVLGRRGSGKSAFAYRVLEEANLEGLATSVMGLPRDKCYLLPDYIHPTSNPAEMEDDSAVLVDEAYSILFAREYQSSFNKFMAKLIGATRQRNQLFMFVTHLCRKLDVSVVYDSDNIIVKEPSYLHSKFERREVREITQRAYRFFRELDDDPRRHAYMITSKGEFTMKVDLPSFWSEELSKAFAQVEVAPEEQPSTREREILESILELERSRDYDEDFGWKIHDIPLLTGGHINKFLAEGLIERGYTSRSHKHFYGNSEKIKRRLGL